MSKQQAVCRSGGEGNLQVSRLILASTIAAVQLSRTNMELDHCTIKRIMPTHLVYEASLTHGSWISTAKATARAATEAREVGKESV